MYGLKYKGQYPQAVQKELEGFLSSIIGWLTREHNEDGTHRLSTSATVEFTGPQRLLGRGTPGAGPSEEVTLGSGLAMSGTVLSVSGGSPSVASITLTGGQLAFPATQNASVVANTLDDYEEGTFTPTDGSGASLVFTNVVGHYVKVGQLVTCWVSIGWPSTADTNPAVIAGLPFASQTVAQTIGAAVVASSSGSSYGLVVDSNATTASFVTQTGLSPVTNAVVSNGSTRTVKFTLSYRSAA